MNLRPRSLFARTALLIGVALALFAAIAWQAILWSSLEPAADGAVHGLTLTARSALQARQEGASPPPNARFETSAPPARRLLRGPAFGAYLESVRAGVQAVLHSPEARVTRVAPCEIWVRLPEDPQVWLVMTWRVAGPKAPLAALGILAAAAAIVLAGAAISARRLTAPLADLAGAAGRIAEGEAVSIERTGPSEVRSLAVAIESMAHRLAEVDEQRELMLAGISHDLRTPLARLRVAMELLPASDGTLLEEMAANIEEIDRMVGQFLRYVRGNYRETPLPADLDQLVREAMRPYASDERVHLALHAAGRRRFAVECMRHCLLNLVQNALEYGCAPIVVRTAVSPGEIALSVQDGGKGLSESEWHRAVRPFQRLEDDPAQGHSGLGLALVQRLVTTCGGDLAAQRTAEGFLVSVRMPAGTA
jgi:two-component system, OmpR family, osmolarity sensor histidine kinase EnvZ